MTWKEFTIIVSILYVLWYGFNIIVDLLKTKGGAGVGGSSDELTFHEDVLAKEVHEPVPIPLEENISYQNAEEDEQNSAAVWERQEEDTEELNILSHNINQSTGGITQMSDLIKLAKSDTIDVKRSFVF